MRIKVVHSTAEYEPMRTLLHLAIERRGREEMEMLRIIVEDAQRLIVDERNRHTVNRRHI